MIADLFNPQNTYSLDSGYKSKMNISDEIKDGEDLSHLVEALESCNFKGNIYIGCYMRNVLSPIIDDQTYLASDSVDITCDAFLALIRLKKCRSISDSKNITLGNLKKLAKHTKVTSDEYIVHSDALAEYFNILKKANPELSNDDSVNLLYELTDDSKKILRTSKGARINSNVDRFTLYGKSYSVNDVRTSPTSFDWMHPGTDPQIFRTVIGEINDYYLIHKIFNSTYGHSTDEFISMLISLNHPYLTDIMNDISILTPFLLKDDMTGNNTLDTIIDSGNLDLRVIPSIRKHGSCVSRNYMLILFRYMIKNGDYDFRKILTIINIHRLTATNSSSYVRKVQEVQSLYEKIIQLNVIGDSRWFDFVSKTYASYISNLANAKSDYYFHVYEIAGALLEAVLRDHEYQKDNMFKEWLKNEN